MQLHRRDVCFGFVCHDAYFDASVMTLPRHATRQSSLCLSTVQQQRCFTFVSVPILQAPPGQLPASGLLRLRPWCVHSPVHATLMLQWCCCNAYLGMIPRLVNAALRTCISGLAGSRSGEEEPGAPGHRVLEVLVHMCLKHWTSPVIHVSRAG